MERALWFTTRVIPAVLVGFVVHAAIYGKVPSKEEQKRINDLQRLGLRKRRKSDSQQADTGDPKSGHSTSIDEEVHRDTG